MISALPAAAGQAPSAATAREGTFSHRLTKGYARIASAQVKQAVNGPDSVLVAAQEPEKALVSHLQVTGILALPEKNPVTQ